MAPKREDLTEREDRTPVVPAILGVGIGVVSGMYGLNWKQTLLLVTGGYAAWKLAQKTPPDWYGGE
jgi:hypothetical protein